jgi:hypothetical protein
MALTAKQTETLKFLAAGPTLAPTLVTFKLIGMGLVEKTGAPGARGLSHVRLTAAGRAAL